MNAAAPTFVDMLSHGLQNLLGIHGEHLRVEKQLAELSNNLGDQVYINDRTGMATASTPHVDILPGDEVEFAQLKFQSKQLKRLKEQEVAAFKEHLGLGISLPADMENGAVTFMREAADGGMHIMEHDAKGLVIGLSNDTLHPGMQEFLEALKPPPVSVKGVIGKTFEGLKNIPQTFSKSTGSVNFGRVTWTALGAVSIGYGIRDLKQGFGRTPDPKTGELKRHPLQASIGALNVSVGVPMALYALTHKGYGRFN